MNPRLILLLLAALFTVSCSDNHDKLMKDQIDYLGEMTEVLNKVADGDLSSSEGAEKIKALGKKGDEFMERKKVLNEDLSPEEGEKLMKKYQDESMAAFKEYMAAVQKLAKSGRMTQELTEAIENMKNN